MVWFNHVLFISIPAKTLYNKIEKYKFPKNLFPNLNSKCTWVKLLYVSIFILLFIAQLQIKDIDLFRIISLAAHVQCHCQRIRYIDKTNWLNPAARSKYPMMSASCSTRNCVAGLPLRVHAKRVTRNLDALLIDCNPQNTLPSTNGPARLVLAYKLSEYHETVTVRFTTSLAFFSCTDLCFNENWLMTAVSFGHYFMICYIKATLNVIR